MAYQDIRWSGSPDAVTTALAGLGHPAFAAEGAVPDPRIAAFGPYAMETVAGRAVMFALLRVPEGTEIEAPEGVFAEPGRVSEAVTGVFMEGPVPRAVPIWKAVVVMRRHGVLEAVEAAVAAAGDETQAWWQRGTEMERYHPRTIALAAALGVDDATLDAWFVEAAAIEA